MDQVQFIQEIGRGSFAKVYKVEYENKIYAMKVLDLEEDNQQINEEIHILQQLNHQNVIKYYKIFLNNSQINILMEYCGCSLYDIISLIQLSEDQAFCILYDIIKALTYLHTFNIIHNDIKPQNILFNNETVKISDFGISKQSLSLYQYQGTPHYSSPEQLLGQSTAHSDFWALGIIYIQIMTGKLLFQEISDLDELFAKKQQIMDYVKELGLSRKGYEFCEKIFRKSLSVEQILRCKGFRGLEQEAVYEQISSVYKQITKQKQFYSPAVSRSFTFPIQQTEQFEWSFSESGNEVFLGFYSEKIVGLFREEGVEIGKISEEQARQIVVRLQGQGYAESEFTEEQQQILRLLD